MATSLYDSNNAQTSETISICQTSTISVKCPMDRIRTFSYEYKVGHASSSCFATSSLAFFASLRACQEIYHVLPQRSLLGALSRERQQVGNGRSLRPQIIRQDWHWEQVVDLAAYEEHNDVSFCLAYVEKTPPLAQVSARPVLCCHVMSCLMIWSCESEGLALHARNFNFGWRLHSTV